MNDTQRRKLFPKAQWTHHADGSVTLGRILDEPDPVRVLDTYRPCTRCKQPTYIGTPRGRPVHPGCEGWLDRLTDEGMNNLLFDLHAVLGTTSPSESDS